MAVLVLSCGVVPVLVAHSYTSLHIGGVWRLRTWSEVYADASISTLWDLVSHALGSSLEFG